MKNNNEISHVEIYFADSSCIRLNNEEKFDKKLTKKQINWIIEECLQELNNFKTCYAKKEKVTIQNYNDFVEDDFSDLPHSEFQMIISLLNSLK